MGYKRGSENHVLAFCQKGALPAVLHVGKIPIFMKMSVKIT
jgi:hypothetical protein